MFARNSRNLPLSRKPVPPKDGAGNAERKASPSGGGRSGDPAEVIEFAEQLRDYHERDLKPAEMELLRKIVALWKRGETEISHSTMNELGITDAVGRSFYQYVEPISLAEHAPIATPLRLWQYLVHQVRARSYGLPTFMAPLNDSEEIIQEITSKYLDERGSQWTQFFESEVEATTQKRPPARTHSYKTVREDESKRPFPAEIRLRLVPDKLQWEARDAPEQPWRPLRAGESRRWLDTFLQGGIPVDPATPVGVLFAQIIANYHADRERGVSNSRVEIQTLRLDEPRTQRLLRTLLLTPALQQFILTDNGRPFQLPPVPLVWRATPGRGDSPDASLTLAIPGGKEVNLSRSLHLNLLEGPPYLAIHKDIVYQCPAPLITPDGKSDCSSLPLEIPLEALLSEHGVRWLQKNAIDAAALPLPQGETVALEIAFCVSVTHRDGGSLGRIFIQLDARSPDPKHAHRRRCHEGTWKVQQASSPSGEAPVEYLFPEEDAAAAEEHLSHLDVSWEPFSEAYTHRFGIGFLDEFSDWLQEAKRLGFALELPPDLEPLARDPDIATLDIQLQRGAGESGVDWFDLNVALMPSATDLTKSELDLLLRARGKFVQLPGKGFRRTIINLDKDKNAALLELGIETSELTAIAEHYRYHTLQLVDASVAPILTSTQIKQIRDRASQIRTTPPPPVPAALTATLRPYQVEGFQYLAHLATFHLGGILADDMGLGKTVQTLAWLLWLNARAIAEGKPPLRALIVCPKSVVPNWVIETERFAPSLTSVALDADNPVFPPKTNITVMNYAQLRSFSYILKTINWDAAILDEGQNIKTPTSIAARSACELVTPHRLILTGTPIENRLLDLWSLFNYAMPGLLGTQSSFRRGYNEKTDADAQTRLAARVRPFMLRRAKSQVATDLPPRIEEDLYIDLEGPQRALYDAELKQARQALLGMKSEADFARGRFNILHSLLRLRQICCHPALLGFAEADAETTADSAEGDDSQPASARKPKGKGKSKPAAALAAAAPAELVDDTSAAPAPKRRGRAKKETPPAAVADSPEDEDANEFPSTPSAKLNALLDQIDPIIEEGHRVLVFSQFVSVLNLVRDELLRRNIAHLMLTGKTENRQELVRQFQATDGPPVFLLSLKAAGSGLNLTAASYVFLFDPWWNPAVEAQAIDRTHRIGQQNQVIAYRLLARDTIEEKIRRLQERKAALARTVVREAPLEGTLNFEDLQYVLS